MKKLILAAFAVTCAVSVFAQGTVAFDNRTAAGFTHVWGPSPSNPGLSLVGAGSNDTVITGTTPYAADGMTMIGSIGTVGRFGGSSTFAQLLAANGAGAAEASLIPASLTTSFRTGGAQGNLANGTATLTGIPVDANFATIELVAWDNSSGLYPTWAQASVAWNGGVNGLIFAGKSGAFTIAAIGGGVNTAPNMYIPSFNLYNSVIPEPSTFALAGLGLAALVAFRRRS